MIVQEGSKADARWGTRPSLFDRGATNSTAISWIHPNGQKANTASSSILHMQALWIKEILMLTRNRLRAFEREGIDCERHATSVRLEFPRVCSDVSALFGRMHRPDGVPVRLGYSPKKRMIEPRRRMNSPSQKSCSDIDRVANAGAQPRLDKSWDPRLARVLMHVWDRVPIQDQFECSWWGPMHIMPLRHLWSVAGAYPRCHRGPWSWKIFKLSESSHGSALKICTLGHCETCGAPGDWPISVNVTAGHFCGQGVLWAIKRATEISLLTKNVDTTIETRFIWFLCML